jgi:hypothetical protein
METQIQVTPDHFTQVNNDVNGNPRHVIHFVHFIPDSYTPEGIYIPIDKQYERALILAKKIGGRKFHNKQYGGGILFHAVNVQSLCNKINTQLNTK